MKKNTTLYVLNIIMRKQTQGMNRPINNWRQRRTEHCVYEESITDITTRNSERKDLIRHNTEQTPQKDEEFFRSVCRYYN